ncbi:pilus assembly protein FilA [Acinetobacter proteolyticus]|jgi:hypothetical protein|uniref:Pilus assembly protein FilA n=1 Tax=Acinetobacter proteolyticus TaxID=1776741 RepID=A0A653K4E3_9GAMM|nr:DUF6160 family protein [Acinetobacter proteolyticus]OEY92104.1 pilus assembly protein FilA [Acinetobacter proteolyticus]VXA55770.1 Pilus assembly protein FilA [Acinetobacter proteolyticus]
MVKNKKIGCLSLLLLSPLTMAMQPLDDQSLATMTGQDGLNIGLQVQKIDFKQIAIIDTDGFAKKGETALPKAALVMAARPDATSTPIGIDFVQTFNADGSIQGSTSQLLKAVIDTDKGTGSGGAFANIAVTLGNGVNGMRIRPFSVYLVPDNVDAISSLVGSNYAQKSIFSSGTTLKSNIKELLRTGNIDIEFIANNKPNMNIQLGAAPQGHMVMFGGALKSICGPTTANPDGCNFNLVSGTTGAKFDLQMTGKDSNGFSLNGFYAGVYNEATDGTTTTSGGLVFGNTGTSDKFNLSLNNIKLGEMGNTDPNAFNNLPNGSIGNFGIKGASITDFKMKVSGM